jgi:uncharacterized protein YceK
MRSLLLLTLVFTITGCASLMNPYVDMTAEQIAAAVKDKNLTAWCLVLNTPYGRGITSILNLDKAVLPPGSAVLIDNECKVSITTGGPK